MEGGRELVPRLVLHRRLQIDVEKVRNSRPHEAFCEVRLWQHAIPYIDPSTALLASTIKISSL